MHKVTSNCIHRHKDENQIPQAINMKGSNNIKYLSLQQKPYAKVCQRQTAGSHSQRHTKSGKRRVTRALQTPRHNPITSMDSGAELLRISGGTSSVPVQDPHRGSAARSTGPDHQPLKQSWATLAHWSCSTTYWDGALLYETTPLTGNQRTARKILPEIKNTLVGTQTEIQEARKGPIKTLQRYKYLSRM